MMLFFRRFLYPGLGPYRRAVIGAAAMFLIACGALVSVILWKERAEALKHATESTAATALALEEHIVWMFQAVDIALGGVADTLTISDAIPKNHPQFQQALRRRAEELRPYVRAIFVIGPDGSILHDSDYPSTPDLSLADRPYFQQHVRNPTLLRSIAPPVQSRAGTGWFVAVTRRIGSDRDFKGIAVAAVQPEYFELLYRRMNLRGNDNISIYHRDGLLIARYPAEPDAVGKPFDRFPLFAEHVVRRSAGTYIVDGGMFPFERVVSYRVLHNAPLVVAVTQDTEGILAPWHQMVRWAALAMTGLTLLLAALIAQYIRRQRDRDREQRRQAQAEKLEALGLVTGGIAHDFNNVLGVIKSSLYVIARRADPQGTEHAVAIANRALSAGSGLIGRLLAFASRQPLQMRRADLNKLLESVGELLRPAAGAGIELIIECEAGLPDCLIDEAALEVAMLNLVVNARDAMDGKGRIVIKTYRSPDNRACLSIEDSGPGMPESVRRRVLEPFFTTKGDAGTGLGLPQVYGFMQQIGGDLRIDSKPGAGTRVRLIFPEAPAL
jgi:two-component system, NtrC family, sensor kinase